MYLYLALVTLVANTFVHLSFSEMRTLHFGTVPPPAPGEKFDKHHWLESVMREDRCPGKGAKEMKCETFDVSGYQYHYKFSLLPKSPEGRVLVRFSVRAEKNAILSLVGENNNLTNMYEIVIGGYGDTKSVFRKSQVGDNVASVDDQNGWLDGQTYKPFWVSATPGTSQDDTETMTISVGRGPDERPFIEYIDRSPLLVNYLGFSAWKDDRCSYKFFGLDLKN